jgi:hypothetical protein
MNGKRGRQVLAVKYIIRRIVALLVVAAIIAVPATLGAFSYERDKNDNHNQIDSESNTLSYEQVEPHVRAYIDEEKMRITSDGAVVSNNEAGSNKGTGSTGGDGVDAAVGTDPAGKDSSANGSSDNDPSANGSSSNGSSANAPSNNGSSANDPSSNNSSNNASSDNTPSSNGSSGGDASSGDPGAGVPVYDTPSSVPDVAIGTVLIYAGDKIPDGFLLCDGREVPRGRYPSLYKVIGEKYGEGDGVTTFNLPDMNTLATNGMAGTVAAGDIANMVSAAANTITVEFAFQRTGATPVYKLSEPTGAPPVVDPEKLKRNDTEVKPESGPTAKGDKPTMYFIIKY